VAAPHIIVLGNEKGGSGKSTTAMHLIVGFLRAGHSVSAIDLDRTQGTLTRFLQNRQAYAESRHTHLPMPDQILGPESEALHQPEPWLIKTLQAQMADVVVIDTPGSASEIGRAAHGFADTIVTPLNDSFVDFDVLAHIDGVTMSVSGLSHYSAMVWEQKKKRAERDGGHVDWIVMRNRLSALDAISKRQMATLMADLAKRVGFRVIGGFGERVIFRDMFPKGLTILDLKETGNEGNPLTLSQVAARQEVRTLIEAVRQW